MLNVTLMSDECVRALFNGHKKQGTKAGKQIQCNEKLNLCFKIVVQYFQSS